MAANERPPGPVEAERYPGEALHLLRSIAADLAELREVWDKYAPAVDAMTSGGLLGAGRRMRDARNGGRGG